MSHDECRPVLERFMAAMKVATRIRFICWPSRAPSTGIAEECDEEPT